MTNERAEFMKDVWLSCETEEQRNNTEKWMRQVAAPWPCRELEDIEEFILIQEDIRDGTNWFGTMEESRIRQSRKMARYRY